MKEKVLTVEQLKQMNPGIFASGSIFEPRLAKEYLKWVAVRGQIHDWAIYYHREEKSIEFVRDYGDKCFTKEVIKELVPCDDEAFKMYRY